MMFGSKIRSWMENHIVRPRKKGNKNKNGSSSNNPALSGATTTTATANYNSQSGYLAPPYGFYNVELHPQQYQQLQQHQQHNTMAVIGNGTNSVPSPARRHEVSPIQCHKTSRFGWHSPTHTSNKHLTSPKPEHFYHHQSDNSKIINNNVRHDQLQQQGGPLTAPKIVFDEMHEQQQHNMYNNKHMTAMASTQHYNGSSQMMSADDRLNQKLNSMSIKTSDGMVKSKGYSTSKQQQSFMEQDPNYQSMVMAAQQQQLRNNIRNHHISKSSAEASKSDFESTRNRHTLDNHQSSNGVANRLHTQTYNKGSTLGSDPSQKLSNHNHFRRITEFEMTNGSGVGGNIVAHHCRINAENNNMDIKNVAKLGNDIDLDDICINAIPSKPSSTSLSTTTSAASASSSSTSAFAKTYKKIFSSSSNNNRNRTTAGDKAIDQMNANVPKGNAQHPHYETMDNLYCSGKAKGNKGAKTDGNSNNLKPNKDKLKKAERSKLAESGYYETLCSNASSSSLQNSLAPGTHVMRAVPAQTATVHSSYNRVTNPSNYLGRRMGPVPGPVQQPPQLAHQQTVGGVQSTNSNHPLAHVINSLSSPESAYSTGYSTDGTSPGATYTPPEYYINMRTGTHYFPKNANSLGVDASRQKFGLNKIEEILSTHHHRRTESYDLNQIKVSHSDLIDGSSFMLSKEHFPMPHLDQMQLLEKQNQSLGAAQFPANANSLSVNYRGFESPSPRQRCRIRTNPWYSTPENSYSASHPIKKTDLDTSSSSSGIKSNSDFRASIVEDEKSKESSEVSDEESDSSSTEVEVNLTKNIASCGAIDNARPLSTDQVFNAIDFVNVKPNIKNRSFKAEPYSSSHMLESDEDTTLNEMMGKFDESYVYEKETDILSNDSDPTHCNSDIDTGQDAGDEYDTEDLLDIDFIDTGSIQEIVEKAEAYKNTGNCSYFSYNVERRVSRVRRSRKHSEEAAVSNQCSANTSASGRRKKRLFKTRKKSCDSKERSVSPFHAKRESRSVGGTPVCLRRRLASKEKNGESKLSPLVSQQRSNSLTLTEAHMVREKFIAIAESEKMLLKADLEADIKYKQLIHEAESILVSMKANAVVVVPQRETPVASPSRRILNPPANKRVEMLRQCEADLKREIQKQQQLNPNMTGSDPANTSEHLINKRLEMLRHEYNSSNSVPASPKCGRLSPRKTHLTNFINQVASSDIAWRNPAPSNKNRSNEHLSSDDNQSPVVRSNRFANRDLSSSPPPSQPQPPPVPKRSFREKVAPQANLIYSYSDSEDELQGKIAASMACDRKHSMKKSANDYNLSERCQTPEIQADHNLNEIPKNLGKQQQPNDAGNYEFQDSDFMATRSPTQTKQPLISFKSIDMGNKIIEMGGYCPQSEPLKRKIYQGSSSFERIKKNLDIESEIPKQHMLNKINSIRRDRQVHSNRSSTQDINSNFKNSKLSNNSSINNNNNDQSAYQSNDEDTISVVSNLSVKQQLILNTIEDLKKSLEDQSVELTAQFEN